MYWFAHLVLLKNQYTGSIGTCSTEEAFVRSPEQFLESRKRLSQPRQFGSVGLLQESPDRF